MTITRSRAPLAMAAGTAVLLTSALVRLAAQAPAPAGAQGGRGGGRGGVAPAVFSAVDSNKDGAVTRDEFTGAFDKWFSEWDAAKSGSLSAAQIGDGLTKALAPFAPAPPPGGGQDACGGRSSNPRVPCQSD